jgi:hypothetical protein
MIWSVVTPQLEQTKMKWRTWLKAVLGSELFGLIGLAHIGQTGDASNRTASD